MLRSTRRGFTFAAMFELLCIASVCATLSSGGCSRASYREGADREVRGILYQKSAGTPWELPEGFSIDPDERSRLFDASDPDYPDLPHPGPDLYSYRIPELSIRAARIPAAEEPGGQATSPSRAGTADDPSEGSNELPVQPIPESYWEALPVQYLVRMFEFESVRAEYRRQYDIDPPGELRDPSQRLTLEEIVELAILNSREYQTQKEQLYLAALALTLERFDYSTSFTPGSTGANGDWIHSRFDGSTTESLGVSSFLGVDKLLATGGTLLARFANNIVLTFDGPDGFEKDLSSELLFGFSQSVFQRDIQMNPLIQSERDVVYAVRDYARFRREFFFQIAAQYYGLLQTYRNIEIESQNYFSLVRTFEQGKAELRAGVQNAPNTVAVDQFEQGMLTGRSNLITRCNQLERSLDSLKLTVGLPTETAINIDLGELDELTLRDEIEVTAERARRWLNRVLDQRGRQPPDRAELLNADSYLIERLLEWLELRGRLGDDRAAVEELPETPILRRLLRGFRVDQARIELERSLRELAQTRDPQAPAPLILVYQRLSDVIEALLRLAGEQIGLAQLVSDDRERIDTTAEELERHRAQRQSLVNRLRELFESAATDQDEDQSQATLDDLLTEATELRAALADLVDSLDRVLAAAAPPDDEEEGADEDPDDDAGGEEATRLAETLLETDRLVEITLELLESAELGLPPISMALDDALATALVQRLDLMNERGRLADDRRNVKLAADDLKSVLNLDATHSIRTRDNKPFRFTNDETETRVALSVDLPLNRRAQRNSYRRSLISYQAGRRSIMALEDQIKFDVRDAVRTLQETRIQYPISVTQAALAAEQVISVRLQLALGVEDVRGVDLLLALQSSREALISVANNRISYIVDRAGFVLDLELLELDEAGLWPRIDDPAYQPDPNRVYPENAGPAYGDVPDFLFLSKEIRQSVEAPPPGRPPAAETEAAAQAAVARGSEAASEPAPTPAENEGPRDGASQSSG